MAISSIKPFGLRSKTWKNIEFNVLPVYDNRFKCARTWCESFTIISTDSLLVYESKHYQQLYLDDCAYNQLRL